MNKNKMIFSQVIKELENIKDKLSIDECVKSIKHGDILFSPGIIQEKNKLASLYKLRVNMQRELHKDKFTSDELDYWDAAVDFLNEYDCEFANLNTIHTNDRVYFLFWNNETQKLISSFWLVKKESLESSEKNNDLIIERGHTVSSIKYSKGQKAKEWKRRTP